MNFTSFPIVPGDPPPAAARAQSAKRARHDDIHANDAMGWLDSAPGRPLTTAKFALTLSLLAFTLPSLAQLSSDQDFAKYRCTVLGDSNSCAPTAIVPTTWIEDRLELGPRALYLRYVGASTEAAIAEARRSGEIPTRHVVRVTVRTLSATEAHERYLGNSVKPIEDVQTLSSFVDFGDQPTAQASNREMP